MPPPVFRFAPSPNGYLHLGHARSALLNADMAKAAGGRLLLRIEDIDETRCRLGYETAIYQDLAWLGLEWEAPVRRQSEHYDDYRAALAMLESMGLIYPSFESRAEIARLIAEREAKAAWPRDPDGAPLYPGNGKSISVAERQRRIASGASYALRLDMTAALARYSSCTSTLVATPLPIPPPQGGREESVERSPSLCWLESGASSSGETGRIAADPAANPAIWGDVILARKEMPTSYHLAVVVDDAAQGVSDVVRGQDLFHATSVHRLLQALLGLPAPRYRHHGLILDADGRKLSKSTQATALRELRAQGATPADIRGLVGLD